MLGCEARCQQHLGMNGQVCVTWLGAGPARSRICLSSLRALLQSNCLCQCKQHAPNVAECHIYLEGHGGGFPNHPCYEATPAPHTCRSVPCNQLGSCYRCPSRTWNSSCCAASLCLQLKLHLLHLLLQQQTAPLKPVSLGTGWRWHMPQSYLRRCTPRLNPPDCCRRAAPAG